MHQLRGDYSQSDCNYVTTYLGLKNHEFTKPPKHYYCKFCTTWLYDIDELYRHCRHSHLYCDICGTFSNTFYETYEELSYHFMQYHFYCNQKECKGDQYVNVFETLGELKSHMSEKHDITLKGDCRSKEKQKLCDAMKEKQFKPIQFVIKKPKVAPNKHVILVVRFSLFFYTFIQCKLLKGYWFVLASFFRF